MTATAGDLKRWLILDECADLVAGAYCLEQLAARVLTAPDSIPEREVDRLLVGWARSRRWRRRRHRTDVPVSGVRCPQDLPVRSPMGTLIADSCKHLD